MTKDYVISLEVNDSGAIQNIDKLEKSLESTSQSANSVKAELRQIQKELANLPQGSKEFDALAKRAGELKDQINDASEAIKANAGNAFETLSNNVGNLGGRFASLDFDGITQDFRGIAGSINNVKADDLSKGLKNVGQTFATLGKALLANPIFLVAAAIIGIGAALVALKDKIKPIGALFDAVGSAITAVTDKIEAFLQAFGLTASEAEKANQRIIDSSAEVLAAIDKRYEREIKLAQAAGKETIFLEIEKRKAQLKTIDDVVKALIEKGVVEGELNDEELKKLNELKQQKLDIETDLQATILTETRKNNDKRLQENEKLRDQRKAQLDEQLKDEQERVKRERDIANQIFAIQKEVAEKIRTELGKQAPSSLTALINESDERFKIQEQQEAVRLELLQEGAEKEIALSDAKFARLREQAAGNAELIKQIAEANAQEVFEIEKKFADEKIANERRLNEQKIQNTLDGLGAIQQLVNSFAAKNKEQAKKQFAINKALGIAQALVSTYQAVNAQLAVPQDALTGANFVKAGIAATVGLANVARIASTKFEGGGSGGGGGSISAGSAGSGGGQSGPPTFNPINTGFLQNRPPQAAPTYVIAGTVTNAQQADQKINELARL